MPTLGERIAMMRAYHEGAGLHPPEVQHSHAKKATRAAHETVAHRLAASSTDADRAEVDALARDLEALAAEAITPAAKWPDPKFTYAYTVRALQAALAYEIFLSAARELRALAAE